MTGSPPDPVPSGRRTTIPKLLGTAVLLVMAPVALLGLSVTPNEYRAMGIDAVDCDGPVSVLIFAVPALLIYGIAAAIFLRRWRLLRFLVPGFLCALLSMGLLWNIGNAAVEQWKNNAEPICVSGQ